MAHYLIEDNDPRVKYSKGWFNNNNSTHLTRVVNSSAEVSFCGNKITVFGDMGTDPSKLPTSSYIIDGNQSTSATFTVPNTTTGVERSQDFYQSPVLDQAGNHTLFIQLLAGDWFWLDYFSISPGSQDCADEANATLETSAVVPFSSTSTSGATPSSSSSIVQQSRPNLGPIIGGAIGGAVFLVLASAIALYLWHTLKKRSRRRTSRTIDDVLPFTEVPPSDSAAITFGYSHFVGNSSTKPVAMSSTFLRGGTGGDLASLRLPVARSYDHEESPPDYRSLQF